MRSPGDVRLQLLPTKRLKPHLFALIPGLVIVGLMLVWAVDDGGYDPGTWYWGALVALTVLTATVAAGGRRLRLGPVRIDLGHNLNPVPGIKSTQYFVSIGQAF